MAPAVSHRIHLQFEDEILVVHASLIVVGSNGEGGLARLLLGSVSEAVAMHASCSVEVIRSGRS